MTASIQQLLVSPPSTFPGHSISKKNPPLPLSEFSRKSAKTLSVKLIDLGGGIKEAFLSLSSSFVGPNPSQFCLDRAYSSVLELCASEKCLSQGQQIHTHIVKSNAVEDSLFLSTKLVFMYGRCGAPLNAEKVFDRMRERTTFTWNALIGAYVTNGEPFGALELYERMRISGVPLDACTFPCVLKACGQLQNIHTGFEIHGLAIKTGLASNLFVVNSLLGMYTKCDVLDLAVLLFDRLSDKQDVVSWNSIISAYAANGLSREALRLFREMEKTGVTPSTYTFVAALQACVDKSLEKIGIQIHAFILKSSHHLDVHVANALLVMYNRCGKVGEALRIFDDIDERDNISWNSMLSGFVQNGLYNEALHFFQEMQDAGRKTDQGSVVSLLAASSRLRNLLYGMEIHAYAIKSGLDSDLQVGNTLVDLYGKCCRTNYMDSIFHRISNKDFISWTTVIAGHAQNNCHVRALELFREAQMEKMDIDRLMIGSVLQACSGLKCISLVKEIHSYILRRGLSDLVLQNTILDVYGECGSIDYASSVFKSIEDKDIVSWTSMITCYVQNGHANEALDLFVGLKETDAEPDSIALMSILSAASSLSVLRKGKEIHGYLIRKCFILEGAIASSLVDMYANCGSVETSLKIFNCTGDKDLVLWTSMINAYGTHGHGKEAINLFKQMEAEHLIPDHITFLAVLHACSHSGLVDEGRRFFEVMESEYQLEPWPEHYTCLVDLLGRADHLQEAFHFVTNMQMEPTSTVWSALLGACRVHSNEELGEIAAHKLLELDPENAGNYVLVSNVFAAYGRWEDVEEVRMRMKGKRLKKDPACSWIEVGNKVHTFVARDKSHPQSVEINQKLTEITEILESEGSYRTQTKFVLHDVEEQEKVKILHGHSERLAIAYGLLTTPEGTPIRITKNLRVCGDCHIFSKLVSKFFKRKIIVRDANRFHCFEDGVCSCGDFW
ncbi:pentatricopeptide repeat-containing protein At3g63370, chloroplastic [Diospyros lotus]|uniref:pentatricopeptide repeat-containing protein At3g63370, chloroplastic n=1 Tax=Diospyros lotus TaxID=55363 RepID=UPI0022554097|nr:pentatricopeptide repeat-containing protein At3g63370, chloroplastic [Diospyros lotus]